MIVMIHALDDAASFHDLFATHPRLTDLVLASDGSRLIASVQIINDQGTRYVSRLWEVDPSGERESRLVARSVQGDCAPAFAADGALLFLSGRENTDSAAEKSESQGVGLWALPDCREARQIAHHPGGISAFAVAKDARAVAYTADLLAGAVNAEVYAELLRERESAMVKAVLYEATTTCAFGAGLGPDEPHTFVLHADGAPVNMRQPGPGGHRRHGALAGRIAGGLHAGRDGPRSRHECRGGRRRGHWRRAPCILAHRSAVLPPGVHGRWLGVGLPAPARRDL